MLLQARRFLNFFLIAIIIAGAGFLWANQKPVVRTTSDPNDKPAELPPSGSRTNQPAVPFPSATHSTSVDGVRVSHFDTDAVRQWCALHGLPHPPELDMCEPSVAETLAGAFESVFEQPTSQSLGALGCIYASFSADGGALELFRRAAHHSPRDDRWPYYIGILHQRAGSDAEAILAFEVVLKLNANYPTTHARLADLYFASGRPQEAERAWRNYNERVPSDWLGWVGLARISLERGDATGAIELLRRAEALGPLDFQVHYYLSRSYLAIGDGASAAKHDTIRRGLDQGTWLRARDPLEDEMHRSTGSVDSLVREFGRSKDSNDYARLAKLAEQIIQRRPGDVPMTCALATIYRKQQRMDEAMSLLDRALRAFPDASEILAIRATVAIAMQQYDAALSDADRAIALNPDAMLAHAVRGRVLMVRGDADGAAAAFQRTIELDSGRSGEMLLLCDVLAPRRTASENVECYEKVLVVDSQNEQAKLRLATLTGTSR